MKTAYQRFMTFIRDNKEDIMVKLRTTKFDFGILNGLKKFGAKNPHLLNIGHYQKIRG
jgi:hypothetical protein